MPYDAQGNYSLPNGTTVSTGDKVLPSQHNPAFNDVASTLSAVLVRDGRAPMTGDLPMGNHKITGLADGTDDTDAATKSQVDATITGPSSAVDGNFVAFDGTSGTLGKDSGKKPADFATAAQGTKADGAAQKTDLASTAASKGASLVGVQDSAGNLTATTVEAALAELAALKPGFATAWVNFDGADGAIRDSYNVNSVTRNSSGSYDIKFATAMANANYAFAISCQRSSSGGAMDVFAGSSTTTAPSTTAFRVITQDVQHNQISPSIVCVVFFGGK